MGGVCCRCHNASGFDDTVLRFPAPLALSMSASSERALLITVDGQPGATADRPASFSGSSSSPSSLTGSGRRDDRLRVPLSQSLANYVSFPFPFVKKPKVVAKSARTSGLWVAKRRTNGASDQPRDPRALVGVPYVGEYWRKSPTGMLVPLSLLELCVRNVCAQLVNAPTTSTVQMNLPTELAAHALTWLKQHCLLERHEFQVLARSLLHEWDLSDQADVEDDWFDDMPWAPLQHLKHLNLTGCNQLSQLGSDRWQMISHLPSLVNVSFHGCSKLQRSAIEMLQFSPKLRSVILSGCSKVDDRCLQALGRLDGLLTLDVVRWMLGCFLDIACRRGGDSHSHCV